MSQHAALETAVSGRYFGDRARSRTHTHRDAPPFKSRAGGGRGADHALAGSQQDLAIRTEVEKAGERAALLDPRRHETRQDVAPDEPAQAWQKAHPRISRQRPAQPGRVEGRQAVPRGFERHVRQRLDIQAAEEVVHDRVADDRNSGYRPGAGARGAIQLRQKLADGSADQFHELARPRAERVLNAAHDVGAVGDLWVERGAHGEHVGGAEIEQLGDQRGRAEIDGDSEAFARRELETRFICEDSRVHLGDLEHPRPFGPGMAGQPPSGRELALGKEFTVRGGRLQRPFQNPDAAALAAAPAAAGKLHSVGEQHVAERRTALHFEGFPERLEV